MNLEPDSQPGRSWRNLLRDRTFGPFVGAKLATMLGVWIHNIVSAVLAFVITDSALAVGAVSIVQFVPLILLSPLGGLLADHVGLVRLMMLGRILSAGGSGGLAVFLMFYAGGVPPTVLPVMLSAFVVGTGFALGSPAMQAVVPSLVSPRDLPGAVALDNMPLMLGRTVGPALGALLIGVAGFAAAFAVAALGHVIFVVVVSRLTLVRSGVPARPPVGRVGGVLRYLKERPIAIRLIIAVAVVGFGVDPVLTLGPALAEWIGAATDFAGAIASAFGVGALIGFLALPLFRRALGEERLTVTGLVFLGVGMIVVAAVSAAVPVLIAFAIAGIGMTAAVTGSTTALHRAVTDEWRGRVMALWIVGFVGMRPVAALVNGAIADLISPTLAAGLTGAIVLLWAIECRPSRLRR